ncbi:hypothetical protein K2X40_01945 [Candidatus Babeliales bacterium]|nr:hypothetical protein [Candidatus Babeliales bacterium]
MFKKFYGVCVMSVMTCVPWLNAEVFKSDGTKPVFVELDPAHQHVHYLAHPQTDDLDNYLQTELEEYVFGEPTRARRATFKQETFYIGGDSVINAPNELPTPYSTTRQQYLVRASELHAAGIETSAFIKLSFDVGQTSFALDSTYKGLANMSIKIGHTHAPELTDFEPDIPTYYTTILYAEKIGWNDHAFFQPFYWDGVRNVIIEVTAQAHGTPGRAGVNQSLTDFVASIAQGTDDTDHYFQRPNIKITAIASQLNRPMRITTPLTFFPAQQAGHRWALGQDRTLYYWNDKIWQPLNNEDIETVVDFAAINNNGLVYCLNDRGQLFFARDSGTTTQWQPFATELTFAELSLSNKETLFGLAHNRRDMYQLDGTHWNFIRSFRKEISLKKKS